MISKKVISDIVSKYSLGNNIEKVKWVITDDKLIINFINDSKNLTGYVEYRKNIGLKSGEYGIFNTSTLIKMLNILDGDILIDTNITNTIEFIVENAIIKESFDPVPFDSNLFKEILKANRTYHSGEIRINPKGILDAHLHHGDDLYTGYYLVRKQENN